MTLCSSDSRQLTTPGITSLIGESHSHVHCTLHTLTPPTAGSLADAAACIGTIMLQSADKKAKILQCFTAITCRKTAISHRKTAISHMKTAITHRKLVSHIENCLVAGGCVLAARVLVRCSVDTPQLLSPLTPPPAPSLPGQEAASVRVSAEQQPATLTSLSLHSSPAQPSPPHLPSTGSTL